MGLDAQVMEAFESLQVPVLTVESFLCRDEEQIKKETGMPYQVLLLLLLLLLQWNY